MRYSSSSSSLLATSTAVVAALFLASTHTLDAAQVTLELPDAKSSVTGLVHTASISFDDEPIAAFLGLPYTEKPLGELRFRSAKVKPLSGHINATTFGAPCLQSGNADPNEFPDPEAPPPSEDCLYLNVWSPHPNATHAPQPANYPASAQSKVNGASDGNEPLLPVMVWIHGGGFGIGTGSERWFNGTELARSQHVVVVTLNYRLGPLGFLASDESDHGTGGMNGIHDIIVALQWLHLHASHFGGDSSSMTVFGQSAGGMAACILAVSPLTRGLVKNVIIESGPCIDLAPAGWGPANEEYAANVSKQFFESVNATSLDQLRELNASLMQWPDPIANDANFPGYFLDGYVMPEPPAEAYKRGAAHVDNIIIGFNSKDGTTEYYGVAPFAANDTACGTYTQCMDSYWGTAAAASIEPRYPPSKFNDSNPAAFIQADADCHLICPSLELASLVADARSENHTNVFVYQLEHFKHGIDVGEELGVVDDRNRLGWASHGADIPFVFGTTSGPDLYWNNKISYPFTPDEAELSASVQGFWGELAHSERPNSAQVNRPSPKIAARNTSLLVPERRQMGSVERVHWPAWSSRQQVLRLRSRGEGGLTIEDDFRAEECEFWRHTRPSAPLSANSAQ